MRIGRLQAVLALGLWLLVVLWVYFPLSAELPTTYSRMALDRNGVILRVWLDEQQQLRMPPLGELCPKYVQALLVYEDGRFFNHSGVDVLALLRAFRLNLQKSRIVSGGSTITMQMVRLRNPQARTLWAKAWESIQALRWERQWTKQRILRHYSTLVPMGGNVVGIDAAAWRYLGHSAANLTWAQAATFAVLPNRPALQNLDRGRRELQNRRDLLLRRLYYQGIIDSLSLQSSLQESLPTGRRPLPFSAPHFCHFVAGKSSIALLETSLDLNLQKSAERLAREYISNRAVAWGSSLSQVSALVMETKTGAVRAWVGAANYWDTTALGRNNGVLARRSTGSTLKPMLYALAMQRGPYTGASLLEDIPTRFGDFQPQNADESFRGWVLFNQALVQSLNVVAVRLLQEVGVEEFLHWLQKAGLNLPRSAGHYGLSLILGGAEASLAELVPLYAMLYRGGDFVRLQTGRDSYLQQSLESKLLHPEAAHQVVNWLKSVQRPEFHQYHRWFNHQVPVAWKTGTSYGSRDAWAIGVNEQWTIGVWVGNFRGGSLPGLSGAASAAPLLFDLFSAFTDRMQPMWKSYTNSGLGKQQVLHHDSLEVCKLSGYARHGACPLGKMMAVPSGERKFKQCPLHRRAVLDAQGIEVCSRCWDINDTTHRQVETHPVQVRSVLAKQGKILQAQPVHKPQCPARPQTQELQWVYPLEGMEVILPRNWRGNAQPLLSEVLHREANARVQWWLNGTQVGQTDGIHRLPLQVENGDNYLWVEDELGRGAGVQFRVRNHGKIKP